MARAGAQWFSRDFYTIAFLCVTSAPLRLRGEKIRFAHSFA
jgi:hypothetical protein